MKRPFSRPAPPAHPPSARAPLPSNRRFEPKAGPPVTTESRPRIEDRPVQVEAKESPQPPSVVRSVPPPPAGPKPAGRIKKALSSAWTGTRILVAVVLVIAASVGAAWGAKAYVTKSPRFSVKTIAVEGASKLSPEAIAKAGGVAVGANVFSVDLDQAKRAIEKEPYVAEATVTRKLPNTINIKVVEREAAIIVALEDKLFLATQEGDVFKELAPEDVYDLPVVTGIKPELAVNDREGLTLLVRRALDVIDEVNKTSITKRYPVQEVHLQVDGTCELIVGREGIAIHLGNPPFKGKLEQADRVLVEIQKRKSNASVIFLDNEANTDRVVVRMR